MTKQTNSPKEVLVDHEEKMSREQAAEFLESVARKLKEEGSFILTHGEKQHEVRPSPTVGLEIKLERHCDKHKFEVELEWKEGSDRSSSISIS